MDVFSWFVFLLLRLRVCLVTDIYVHYLSNNKFKRSCSIIIFSTHYKQRKRSRQYIDSYNSIGCVFVAIFSIILSLKGGDESRSSSSTSST